MPGTDAFLRIFHPGSPFESFLLREEPQAFRATPRHRGIAAFFCASSDACCAGKYLTSTMSSDCGSLMESGGYVNAGKLKCLSIHKPLN
jgi:hypothetical protein